MKRKVNDGSPLLLPEEPLQVLPSLAVAIGLVEAIVLQQLHYWLRRSEHQIDGLPWIYNSYVQWREQFPFWSRDTIRRAILHLEEREIVISTSRFNRNPIDKTKWYSINYRRLNELFASSTMQNASSTEQNVPSTGQDAPMDDANCPHGRCKLPPLPETTTETSTETTTETTTERKPPTLSPPTEDIPPSRLTPEGLVKLYNTETPESHPKVQKLSPARRTQAARYLHLFPDPAFWQTVMHEISASSFLRGLKPSNGHEAFKADFDWLLTRGKDGTENCVKVSEGKYRDTPHPAQQKQALWAWAQAMEEEKGTHGAK